MRFKKGRSPRAKLRGEIGKVMLELLKKKRGNLCQICGQAGTLGKFHIMAVGSHPRLEFVEKNILLTHWMEKCGAHYHWHHQGPADKRNANTMRRIAEVVGVDWEQQLHDAERFVEKQDDLYLLARLYQLKQELKSLT